MLKFLQNCQKKICNSCGLYTFNPIFCRRSPTSLQKTRLFSLENFFSCTIKRNVSTRLNIFLIQPESDDFRGLL